MRQKGRKTITAIRMAVSKGSIDREHISADVLVNIGIDSGTASTFLPKHCKGNPGGYTEYFERISRGVYRLIWIQNR